MSTDERAERVIKGIAASPGVAHGPAFVYLQKELEIPIYEIRDDQLQSESERFEKALVETRKQLSVIRSEVAQKLGEDEAQIFDAHLLVLEDRALIEETIDEQTETGYNIEYAFRSVSRRYIEAFDAMDDPYIKERVTDLRDVAKRVLENLIGSGGGMAALAGLAKPLMLVSEDLTPSDTAGMDKEKVLGVVTDAGSRTSHSVIMARSLGVPAVVGLHDATEQIENDDYVLIDGYDGVVIINPREETLYQYGQYSQKKQKLQEKFESILDLPTETADGRLLSLMANIGTPEDVDGVQQHKADGIGLFRTEGLFLAQDGFPSEQQQFEAYREVAERMKPLPVIVRTLDLGGDKRTTGFFFSQQEDNPFMGFRAIRFCLEHKDVFKDQLRAILRASAYGNLKMMYPMIGSLGELVQANVILEEAKQELRDRGQAFSEEIEVGCMIEIPSAATITDLLAEHCDFFSIGTNDLIQYMLAVDRINDRIAHLYEPNHPAILRTLKHIIDTAHEKNVPVGICGEMAGDPIYVPLLIGLGADELSASAGLLAEIKFLVRKLNVADAEEMVKKALLLSDPYAIFKLLKDFYDGLLEDEMQASSKDL